MTLREVHCALRYIDIRSHNKYAQNAAMWGVKIPMKHVDDVIRNAKLSDPKMDAALEKETSDKKPGMIHPRFRGK